MREMKDSGIPWIGMIPDTWHVTKLNNLKDRNVNYPIGDGDHGQIKPEMYLDEGIPYIRVQNLSWGKKLDYTNMAYLSKEVHEANSKSKLMPGDILVAKTGATIGKTALLPEDFIEANTTSSVGKITVNKHLVLPEYAFYTIASSAVQTQMWLIASQKSAQPGFNIDDMIYFKMLLPSLSEQQKIATYLDQKVALIDNIIEKTKESIEEYKKYKQSLITETVTKGLNPDVKMKDSGIEWIGEIPEHWRVVKIKYLSDVLMGQSPSSDDYNDEGVGLEFLQGNADFSDYFPEARLNTKNWSKASNINDVLLSVRAPVGAKNISDKRYAIGRGLCSITPNLLNRDFLWYLIDIMNEEFKYISRGSTYDSVTVDDVRNSLVTHPPMTEQKEIAKFLNGKVKEVEKFISTKIDLISELETYKKSLIYEVVTGKKEIQ